MYSSYLCDCFDNLNNCFALFDFVYLRNKFINRIRLGSDDLDINEHLLSSHSVVMFVAIHRSGS